MYSKVSNKRTVYAYSFPEKILPVRFYQRPVSWSKTTKYICRWLNLDFLESLGPKEWEKPKARAEFKLFVK